MGAEDGDEAGGSSTDDENVICFLGAVDWGSETRAMMCSEIFEDIVTLPMK